MLPGGCFHLECASRGVAILSTSEIGRAPHVVHSAPKEIVPLKVGAKISSPQPGRRGLFYAVDRV
ncbi:MAG: hypothetical protein JWN03_3562 [Nocardia sp.]|nr:hypothetical protein [Nocardia sp.]